MQAGDVIDMHQYVGPNAPLPTLRRAAVLGEFGGLGLRLEGHLWTPEDSFSYQLMNSPAELEVSSDTSRCETPCGLALQMERSGCMWQREPRHAERCRAVLGCKQPGLFCLKL